MPIRVSSRFRSSSLSRRDEATCQPGEPKRVPFAWRLSGETFGQGRGGSGGREKVEIRDGQGGGGSRETFGRGCDKVGRPCHNMAGGWRGAFLRAAPFLVYAYPAIAGLLTRSVVPVALGRYSKVLLAFNAWNFAALALGAWSLAHVGRFMRALALLMLIGGSMVAPFNAEMRAFAGMAIVLPFSRLLAAGALVAGEFAVFRALRAEGVSSTRPSGAAIAFGSLFLFLSILDLAILGWSRAAGRVERVVGDGLRVEYDWSSVGDDDVLLVGDSYVWGAGVEREERFGDRLTELWKERGKSGKALSLGVNGAAMEEYSRILTRVPDGVRARKVILAYYMNDFERAPDWRETLIGLLTTLRHGSPTLGLLGDRLATRLTPTPQADHASIARRYDPSEPTYPARWSNLRGWLKGFRELAVSRSRDRPLFLILPMMTDFEDYPLTEAHHDLVAVATEEGFDTLDLLPLFRDRLGDGRKHWASPDDNHFDAETHALVTQALADI